MRLPVVGYHQGQRTYAPRQRPDIRSQPTRSFGLQKVLAIRGRPHTTTGGSIRSPRTPVTTFSKSSKRGTADARPSSPAKSPWIAGIALLWTPLTPTRSWTALSTMPIGSISPGTACAAAPHKAGNSRDAVDMTLRLDNAARCPHDHRECSKRRTFATSDGKRLLSLKSH